MSLPATDNFNRTTETPLGGNWTSPTGTADSKFNLTNPSGNPANGHLEGSAGSEMQWMYWNADTFDSNQKSQATLGGVSPAGATTYGGVAVRVQTGSVQSGYYFGANQGVYKLVRRDSASDTVLADSLGTPVAADVLRLEAEGTTLRAYVNGGLVTTQTDSTYSSGAAGLFGYSGSDLYDLDDWTGDNLADNSLKVNTGEAEIGSHIF